MQAEKQLSDKAINKDVTFNKNVIPNLTKNSNKNFENLSKEVLLAKNNSNTPNFILKTLAIWKNYIFSLTLINGYGMYLGDL